MTIKNEYFEICYPDGSIYEVIISGVSNPRGNAMLIKCFESLRKAKPDFGTELDKYQFAIYREHLSIYTILESGDTICTEICWEDLIPEKVLGEFSNEDLVIPDDLTAEQELEIEKVIVRRIWQDYRIRQVI